MIPMNPGFQGVALTPAGKAIGRSRQPRDMWGNLHYVDPRTREARSMEEVYEAEDFAPIGGDGGGTPFGTYFAQNASMGGLLPGTNIRAADLVVADGGGGGYPARGIPQTLPGNPALVEVEEGSVGGGIGAQGYSQDMIQMMGHSPDKHPSMADLGIQVEGRRIQHAQGGPQQGDTSDKRAYSSLQGAAGYAGGGGGHGGMQGGFDPHTGAYVDRPTHEETTPGYGQVEIAEQDMAFANFEIFGDDKPDEMETFRQERYEDIERARGNLSGDPTIQRAASADVAGLADEVIASAQERHNGNIEAAITELAGMVGTTSPETIEAVMDEIQARTAPVDDHLGLDKQSPIQLPSHEENQPSAQVMQNQYKMATPPPASVREHSGAVQPSYQFTGEFPSEGSWIVTSSKIALEQTPDGRWRNLKAGALGRVMRVTADRFDVDFGPQIGAVIVDATNASEVEDMSRLSSVPELHNMFVRVRQAGLTHRQLEKAVEKLWGPMKGDVFEIRNRLYSTFPGNEQEIDFFLNQPGMEVHASTTSTPRRNTPPSASEIEAALNRVAGDGILE